MRAIIVTITLALAVSTGSNNALDIDCIFQWRWHDFVGTVLECNATFSAATKNIVKVTSVVGTGLPAGKNFSDVRTLRINHKNLEFFPTNIQAFFPNLQVITLYGNAISEVKNAHLRPFPHLVALNLYTNRISVIDGNVFDGLDSMQYVSFEKNRVVHVGHDFALPKAGLVFFDANPCIDMRASTPETIEALRFNILINCTLLGPVEAALAGRDNFLTNFGNQIQILGERLNSLDRNQAELKAEVGDAIIHVNDQVQSLTTQVTSLKNRLQCLTNEVRTAIGSFTQRLAQTGYSITNLLTSVKDLLDRNANLERRQTLSEERLKCLEMGSEGKCALVL